MNHSATSLWAAVLQVYHPRFIRATMRQLDAEPISFSLPRAAISSRVFWVLATVSVSLWFIHYGRLFSSFEHFLAFCLSPQAHKNILQSAWLPLFGYIWWTSVHLVGYLLLPWMLARWVLKQSIQDWGLRLNKTMQHWRGYVVVAAPILVFIGVVSQGEDFVNHYPFYVHAGRSWVDLIAWECLYILQFILLEFFFRGFLLSTLRPVLGVSAVFVMCVPYMMIHLPKLPLEAFGAIIFGLLLGLLALQSRSIWGGVAVHTVIALSMDIAALWQKCSWPSQWMP